MATAQTEEFLRRNRPGCKASEFYNWPAEDIDQMESTLSVQQFIQQNIRRDTLDVDAILSMPPSQDEGVWKYEHLRQFCLDLNDLTVLLQDECNPEMCTKMMATDDWVFLCAAHKQPKECPAIDYTRHTLDGAASLLNSCKFFPSRVTIKDSAVAKLGSICRRIYRIFAHSFFHHRDVFNRFESETALCLRFTKFVKTYLLMTEENLLVPLSELESLVQRARSGQPQQQEQQQEQEEQQAMAQHAGAEPPLSNGSSTEQEDEDDEVDEADV